MAWSILTLEHHVTSNHIAFSPNMHMPSMWEDGEGVTINVKEYAHYQEGEIKVVLEHITDQHVAVQIPDKDEIFLVHQDDVKKPTDY